MINKIIEKLTSNGFNWETFKEMSNAGIVTRGYKLAKPRAYNRGKYQYNEAEINFGFTDNREYILTLITTEELSYLVQIIQRMITQFDVTDGDAKIHNWELIGAGEASPESKELTLEETIESAVQKYNKDTAAAAALYNVSDAEYTTEDDEF